MSTCYNPFSLEGKTILVTGASSGIGRATAIECSRMGAKLIVTGRNSERLNDTFRQLEGENHMAVVADLTDPEAIKYLVKELQPIDGCVFCAGIANTSTIKFSKPELFYQIFEINFFSQTELFRQILKIKKYKKGCSCVFIDSIGGNVGFSYGNMIYGTSKAALRSFVKFAAIEMAPNLIRVNAVLPGMVNTPLTKPGTISKEELDSDAAKYPLGRYGEPNEVAYACLYLLSDASSWITGIDLIIDGGISIPH